MPRQAQYPPPIYVDRNGNARARVWKDGRPRDVRLGKDGSPEARAKYARLLAELSGAAPPPPPPPPAPAAPPPGGEPWRGVTVRKAVVTFLRHARRHYSRRGREYENHKLSLLPLLRLYGRTLVADFRAAQLVELQRAMADGRWLNAAERETRRQRKQPAGWCRNVITRRVVRVRTAWRWLEQQGLVPPGSYEHLRSVPRLPKNPRLVRVTPPRLASDPGDLARVLPHCPRPVAAMLELQHLCGMRSCEVWLMRAGDVDRSDPACWLYRPATHKRDWEDGAPPRVVPIGPEAQKVLAPWLEGKRPAEYLFRPVLRHRRSQRHYTSCTYAQAVSRACKKAGVKLTPYCLRHGAKERVTREMGLDAARAFLGHKSLPTTNGYNAQQDVRTATEVAKRLG